MKIQILGTGCSKCVKLTHNAEEAVKEAGVNAEARGDRSQQDLDTA
jgi:hypothetical protein